MRLLRNIKYAKIEERINAEFIVQRIVAKVIVFAQASIMGRLTIVASLNCYKI